MKEQDLDDLLWIFGSEQSAQQVCVPILCMQRQISNGHLSPLNVLVIEVKTDISRRKMSVVS